MAFKEFCLAEQWHCQDGELLKTGIFVIENPSDDAKKNLTHVIEYRAYADLWSKFELLQKENQTLIDRLARLES